ncbi:RHS repeat domain-containing protein [Variovorax sp. YR566]|uniref:RHS repeat domain-containing protein n=1 Tax=Variovorax sp. YR566 TaxID=3450237 RepID=UPI003F7D0E43
MPIAAVIDGDTYAIHSDHLNTPRKLTNANGQAVWQWGYSAFGEDQPTIARNRFANHEVTPSPGATSISEVQFNLRYPGQYADKESRLFYNYFRSYDARIGSYLQNDCWGVRRNPTEEDCIDLRGGNRSLLVANSINASQDVVEADGVQNKQIEFKNCPVLYWPSKNRVPKNFENPG